MQTNITTSTKMFTAVLFKVKKKKNGLCDDLQESGGMGGWRGGKEAQEGGDICIHIADSRCCASETNNTVKQLHSNKEFHTQKNFKWKPKHPIIEKLCFIMSSVLSTILTDLSKQNCPTHSPSERAAMTDTHCIQLLGPTRV